MDNLQDREYVNTLNLKRPFASKTRDNFVRTRNDVKSMIIGALILVCSLVLKDSIVDLFKYYVTYMLKYSGYLTETSKPKWILLLASILFVVIIFSVFSVIL